MAQDAMQKYMETTDPLEILRFSKKLLHFSNVLAKEAEKEGKTIWDMHKLEHPDMSYTSGGALYDWDQDPVYASIKLMLEDRLVLLMAAVKRKDKIYDADGVEVTKCKIKGYRKDSINVKL